MAKATDTQIEDTDAAVISDILVPDLISLGWPPADHVFIHVEGQQAVGEFYSPGAGEMEDITVIEFTATDIPANRLLADIGNQDLENFDLNDLFVQADTVPEGRMKQVSDGSAMESAVAETAPETDLSLSYRNDLPINMTFPQLTIVIDDESDPGTVAI